MDRSDKLKTFDVRGSGVTCDERCGCPSPCPGGISCKCASGGGPREIEHKRCSCGEHCGCNPCSCTPTSGGSGKANCKCGDSCTCATCAS